MKRRLCAMVLLAGPLGCSKSPPNPAVAAASSLTGPLGSGGRVAAVSDGAPGAAPSASAPSAVPIRNVLLLTIDSLRADMPWAGYERPIAPRLTELEKSCVSYTHAYSISSYTSMSVGGFLGGKLPSELRRDGNFFGVYNASNLMFPEVLSDKGFYTLAAHAHGYFASAGFQQGFVKWNVLPNLKWNPQTDENVTSPAHEALAETMLSDVPEGKSFFAWFHFLDPHDQYMSHEKDGIAPYGKKLRDQYDGEVQFTDQYIGKLLDFAKTKPWWSSTAVIVTSDHGEALGEHSQFRHGFEVWENLARVPFMVCLPGNAPRRIDAKRSGLDLAPTVLDLLGVEPDPHFTGKSLASEVRGGPAEDRDVVIDLPATSNNEKRRALIHEHFKIIGFGDGMYPKVFDLAADPGELAPLDKSHAMYSEMQKRLFDLNKSITEVPPTMCGKGCLEGTKK
jgi:choline-sulfatase